MFAAFAAADYVLAIANHATKAQVVHIIAGCTAQGLGFAPNGGACKGLQKKGSSCQGGRMNTPGMFKVHVVLPGNCMLILGVRPYGVALPIGQLSLGLRLDWS